MYLLSPLLIIIALTFHLKVFGRNYGTLIMLAVCSIWGLIHLTNPFSTMMLPNMLYDPNKYDLFRIALVLIQLSVSILAVLKKNNKFMYGSYILLVLILLDFCWSQFDGRYAGP